jgi:nucleoside-diphosphate-sugar epimerase
MKVLITSGTGYIGRALSAALNRDGHEVCAVTRSDKSRRKLESQGIDVLPGDIREPAAILEHAGHCDAFVHSAFSYGADCAETEQRLAQHVLNALSGTKTRVIYTSGAWVYGATTGLQAITEDGPIVPARLVSWRPAVENLYLNARTTGLHSIVIRPAVVYGGEGGIIGQMLDYGEKYGVVRYVGTGTNFWSLIHVDDLANLYIAALHKAKPGSVYNACAGEAMNVHSIALVVAEKLGIPSKLQSWPLEEARRVLGDYADALALSTIISSTKAQTELGWHPQHLSLSEAYAFRQPV